MAERRMFARTIIESDAFIDLSFSAQALYLHLCMFADDDGFVNNPKRIMRSVGAAEDDMRTLESEGYIIPFPSGVMAVKHWKVHNYIQKDRYKETRCTEEVKQLQVLDNKEYSLVDTSCIHNGYNMDTQVSKDKGREEKERGGKEEAPAPRGICENVFLTEGEYNSLKQDVPDLDRLIEKLSLHMASSGKTYGSHAATLRLWSTQDEERKQRNRRTTSGDWCSGITSEDHENDIEFPW